MPDRYDPARAKPETVAELVRAYLGGRAFGADFDRDVVAKLRSECRIPLRTRAEVDAEIAALVRPIAATEYPSYQDGWRRIRDLCSEPTSDTEDHTKTGTAPPGAGAEAVPPNPSPVPAEAAEEPVPGRGGSLDERFQQELCRRIADLEQRARALETRTDLLHDGKLGPGQLVPDLLRRVNALESAVALTQPFGGGAFAGGGGLPGAKHHPAEPE